MYLPVFQKTARYVKLTGREGGRGRKGFIIPWKGLCNWQTKILVSFAKPVIQDSKGARNQGGVLFVKLPTSPHISGVTVPDL